MLKNFNFLNLILVSTVFFPFWLVFSNESKPIFKEIFFLYILAILIFYTLTEFLKKKKFIFFEKILISLLIFFGLDINFGLWLIFDKIFDLRVLNYIFSLIIIITICFFIFKLIKKDKNKKFFTIILVGLTFYNSVILLQLNTNTKRNYENEEGKNQTLSKNQNRKLIIYLDEMVGPGAINPSSVYGKKALKSFKNTFANNNFKIYENSFSIFPQTVQSITHSLNFSFDKKNNTKKYSGENYFDRESKWYVKKNKFFDQSSSVLANKSLGLDFCRNKNVDKCVNINADLLSAKFIEGFDVSKKEYVFNKFHKTNSILIRYIWRIFYSISFFPHYSDFTYQKAYFENNLEDIFDIISNTNYEVNLFHLLVPHRPFGYRMVDDKKCIFDKKRIQINHGTTSEINKKYLNEYYQEVTCTNIFLNNFFQKLKRQNIFENLDILVISDTGVGMTTKERMYNYLSGHSILFAIKTNNEIKINKDKLLSSQFLFAKFFDKTSVDIKLPVENFIYDNYKKKFIVFNDFRELISF